MSQSSGYTAVSRTGAYAGTRWRKVREIILNDCPLCVMCAKENKITPATVVDHIDPVTEVNEDFYRLGNLQPLCDRHHRQKTRTDNSKYSKKNRQKGKELMNKFEN